jgi:hypothetical protein
VVVIKYKSCYRRCKLDETLLRPSGSRVRCSKCGAIFHVYIGLSGSRRDSTIEPKDMVSVIEQGNISTFGDEKRKHPRMPVSIPVLCDALDLEGNPHDIYIGAIKEVSQTGLAIELLGSPVFEQVPLSFINVENRDVQIKAKVVHSRAGDSFKTRVGLSLAGSAIEIDQFVSQVIKTNHFIYNDYRQGQVSGFQNRKHYLT